MKYLTQLSAVLILAAGVASAPAAARDGGQVRYSDLDLSTAAGQQELEKRVDRAAKQVCGIGQEVTGSRVSSSGAKRCYTETMAQMKGSIDSLVAAEKERAGG